MTQNGVKRVVCASKTVCIGALLLLMATSAFAQISFIARRDYPVTNPVANTHGAVSADFNGDTAPDIAVLTQTGFSVALGNLPINGTFQTPTGYSYGVTPVAIATGDLTGTGTKDIVLANAGLTGGNTTISAILNVGGVFQTEQFTALPTGATPAAVTITDFDGDGIGDVAVGVTIAPSTYQVVVFLGNGDGTFQAGTQYAVDAPPNSIATATFHTSPSKDIVTTGSSATSSSVTVLLNNGSGAFPTSKTTSTGSLTTPVSIVADSFKQNGTFDVAVADPANSQFIVMLGKGDGTFNTPVNYPFGDTVAAIASGNFSGKIGSSLAYPSLAILSGSAHHSVAIWVDANGDGTFAPPPSPVNFDVAPGTTGVIGAVLRPSLFISDVVTNFLSVGLSGGNNGTDINPFQVAKSVPLTQTGTDFNSLITDDFNLDGISDVASTFQLAGTSGLSPQGNVFLGPITRGATKEFNLDSADDPAHQVNFSASGDFNLDGKPDLAVSTNGTIELLLGNGDGTFQAAVPLTTGGTPYGIAAGDFNGDGIPDLIVSDLNQSGLELLLGNGDGTFQSSTIVTLLSAGAGIAVGDLNADGKLDVVVAANDGVEVLVGNGDGTFQSSVKYGGPGSFASVAIGTLRNTLGSPLDVVAAPGCGGCTTVSLFLGNGDGTLQAPTLITNVGLIPTFVAIADLDASGTADLAIVNTGWDDVAILSGNGDGTFGPAAYYGANGAGTIAIQDFDTNGSPDLAVAAAVPANDKISIVLNSSSATFAGAQLAPHIASFGGVGLGSTSSGIPVVLTNPTNASSALNIASITTTSGDFTASPGTNCTSLAAGTKCTITVTFKPTVLGLRTGSFTITDNAWNHSQTIQVSGTGVYLTVTPPSLSFANTNVGTQTATQTVTVSNTSTSAVVISSIAFATGTNFVIPSGTNTCPGTLNPSSSCTVGVAFAPTVAGSLTDTLNVTDSSNNVQSVTLSGTGVDTISVSVTPSSLSFGNVAINTLSTQQTVTITNTGTGTVTISNITVTGQFAQSQTCVGTLDPGLSCPIQVQFSPTSAGAQSGSLIITDTAPNSPETVTLSGTGVAPTLTVLPATLSFGSIAVGGSPSAAQTVTVTNTSTVSATIINVLVGGTNAGDFSQTNTCGGPLAAGANCTASVQFAPTAAGSRSGTLTVTSNASGSPQSITMTGTGVNPTLTASPNPLAFGNYPINIGPSPAFPVTITNSSTATITIASATLGGTNASDFAVGSASTCGGPLAPNATCVESIQFAPAAAGARSATLTVTYDTNNLTLVVPITGTGVTDALNLQISGNTSQTISAGSSASYGLTMGGNGFAGSVALTCTVSPAALPCSFTPASPISIVGNAQTAFTVKVTTTARSAAALHRDSNMSWAWAMGVFGLLMLPGAARNKRALKSVLVLITFAMLLLFVGCGGGSSSSGGGGGGGGGTTPGTYTINVQASSTGLPSGYSKTLTLIVQ